MGASDIGVGLDVLERKLDVRRRARADGARNDPAPEACDIAACEQEILAAVSGAHARFAQARAEAAQALEAKLRRMPLETAAFDAPLARARLELRRIAGRERPALKRRAEAAQGASRALEHFRSINALQRPAIYPRSTILAGALLVVAAAFEAVFSATLFVDAPGAEGGYVNAAAIALGLSGANVAAGFLGGFLGLRYLQHVSPAARALGAAAFGAALLAAFGLNAFAVLWRERLAADETFGDASGWIDRLAHLSSPQAVILLMLGGGVWVFSALKGYSGVDDPYPDYGKMHRAAVRAADDAAAARDEARDEMDAVIAEAEAEAQGLAAKTAAAARARQAALDETAAAIEALEMRARQSEAAGAQLITLYRRENRAARAGPAPAYFDDPMPFALPFQDVLAAPAALVREAVEKVRAEESRLAAALESLTAELDDALPDAETAA